MIIGAQKAGTTSLFYWLAQHPKVRPPLTKETQFFDFRYKGNVKDYFGYFPRLDRRASFITGEATPSYLFMPEVPDRVHSTFGSSLKLIVLLRHPVDRAISHYFHEVRLGYERLPLIEALQAEDERLAAVASLPYGNRMRDFVLRHFSYVARSRYEECIDRWKRRFPHSMLIVRSESMFEDPQRTLKDCLEFLGLESHDVAVERRNIGRYRNVPSQALAWLNDQLGSDIAYYESAF